MSERNQFDSAVLSRRTLLKGAAGTGAAAVGLGTLDGTALDPVGEADAIVPVVVAAGAAGAVAVGWALREYEVVGSNPPAEGLTGSALKEDTYQTARTRKSTNSSTFVDNRNIIDTGFKDNLYAEGKIAAIEALNNGVTESEVEQAALNAAEAQGSTVESNLLKSWNESINELYNMRSTIQSHGSVSVTDCLGFYMSNNNNSPTSFQSMTTTSATLADGSTMTVNVARSDSTTDRTLNPVTINNYNDGTHRIEAYNPDGGKVNYLTDQTWNDLLNLIGSNISTVKSNLSTWVSNIYGSVQSGELDTSELLTPSQLAEMSTSNSEYNQAVADLQAMNLSFDVESEVVVNPGTVNAEISGTLASTGDVTFEKGTTVDPSADSYSYYFTYDTSTASGTWSDYQSGVDGGTVTFTSEPLESTVYEITTNAPETVTAQASDFTDNGDGTFSVDLSSKLETNIAEITEVTFSSGETETNYVTVQLTIPFDVVSITNSSGDSVDTTSVTSEEAHDDTNYITKSEWEDRLDRQEKLIQEYEDSQDTSGPVASTGLLNLSGGDIPGGVVVVGAIGAAAYLLGR